MKHYYYYYSVFNIFSSTYFSRVGDLLHLSSQILREVSISDIFLLFFCAFSFSELMKEMKSDFSLSSWQALLTVVKSFLSERVFFATTKNVSITDVEFTECLLSQNRDINLVLTEWLPPEQSRSVSNVTLKSPLRIILCSLFTMNCSIYCQVLLLWLAALTVLLVFLSFYWNFSLLRYLRLCLTCSNVFLVDIMRYLRQGLVEESDYEWLSNCPVQWFSL